MRTPRFTDATLLAGATFAMLAWSLLAHTTLASLAGIGVALWFPASVRLYAVLLHWLPVASGVRTHADYVPPSQQQQHELVAGCLLTAACTLTLLIYTPPSEALACGIALNFANLLAQFDRREGWLPNAILMPMLLCGLLAGAGLGYPGNAITGACTAWILGGAGLFALSISLRGNFMSGADALLLCACGAWVGFGGIWAFLLFAGCGLWGVWAVRRTTRTPMVQVAPNAALRPVWRYPLAIPCALGLLPVFLLRSTPLLPHWAQTLLGG
ncbi:prepilin peptidase [Acetobacter ghanensis]|uniref:prepilin peptidase n=1 Tax=Acetobacter ghanensis TaxID=431306 RepID=UPI003D34857E